MFKKASAKKNLVGLDIGSSAVKAVELARKGPGLQLLNLGFENLQTDTIVDGQIMELNNVSNVIAHIFSEHQIRTTRVAAGVSGHSVIVKNIVLPHMSDEELQESFSWHAEEHIPFDIVDVNLDYELTSKSSESLHVLMAACKSDKINNVKQAIQLAGKQPVIIDVDAFALQNCYEANYAPRQGEIVALLNIGAATMNINILNGARSIFARDASAGGSHYTGLLQKELGISFEQAEAVKRGMALPDGVEAKPIQPIIETVSETLALEVKKTFDFYRATAQEGDASIQKILLAGGGSKLPGLPDFLAARFDIPVEVFDPFRQIEVDATKFDPDYMREIVPEMAVAVGLALRGVES
ncbi:MAG TPA: type IV pilus assembly protein PilM [Pyrinomonadaceae bacterium]|nr:type IV pilus assembly protein PilM [Pyrinomonadaceae bacterium]